MTTQEQMGRLASVIEAASSSHMAPHPVIAGPPFAIRKVPLGLQCAEPDRLPVFLKVGFHQEARSLIAERRPVHNHRRFHPGPTLPSAVVCLISSVAAVLATSPGAEEAITAAVPSVIQFGGEAGSMLSAGGLR